MTDAKKRAVAKAALSYIEPGEVIGIGTGSTVNHFIEALATMKGKIEAAVSTSEASSERLRKSGIRIIDLNQTTQVHVYVDGADETTRHRHLIKGGGGALTREKIVAAAAEKFVCIVDDTKLVNMLGDFPLPVEVIPMARSFVARKIISLGGKPVWREGFITDNGNQILDIHNLNITDPCALETTINQITGVITNGLFANRGADIVLVGTDSDITQLG
tara:strand:- start:438 stop:1091 length:654 start_codon:yes stop_codon:yes gene_type:complete